MHVRRSDRLDPLRRVVVFVVVFELVRRRYLRERYALLWLGAALVLLVLAVWTSLLTHDLRPRSGSRPRRTRSS